MSAVAERDEGSQVGGGFSGGEKLHLAVDPEAFLPGEADVKEVSSDGLGA